MPAYHVALVKLTGNWTIQFGAYEKSTVKAEIPELAKSFDVKKKDIKIITCPSDESFCIDACVSATNAGIEIEDPYSRFEKNKSEIAGRHEQLVQGLISVTEFCTELMALGYVVVTLPNLQLFDVYVGVHLDRVFSTFGPY